MNDIKAIDTHLDCMELLDRAKDILSVDKKEMEMTKILDTEELASLFYGKRLSYNGKHYPYVAPILIEDKNADVFYPLFFFTVRYEGDYLYIDDDLPLFNPLAVSFLEELGIKVKDDFVSQDILTCVVSLNNSVETKKVFDRTSVQYALSFADDKTLLFSSISPFLVSFSKREDLDDKYLGLFKEVKNVSYEKDVNEMNVGFHARVERALKRLSLYKGTKIAYQGEDAFKDSLLYIMDSFANENKNVLFVLPESEKKQFKEFLKEERLDSLCFDYDDFSLRNLDKLTDIPKRKMLSDEEENKISSFEESEDRYISFYEKKDECFKAFKGKKTKERLDFVCNHVNDDMHVYPLDVSGYTEDDYSKDKEFIDTISSLDSIKDSYITNHPYYRYIGDGSEENYEKVNSFIMDLVSYFIQLKNCIDNNKYFLEYNIKVNCIKDLRRIRKSFNVLSEYNGFPRKYFKMSKKESEDYPLSKLKANYQALSSSKLLVDKFFTDNIYLINIDKLIKEYENSFFIKKFKIKKEIMTYLKVRKKEDVNTLIRVLKSYNEARHSLLNILPGYLEEYGDNVSTMNGVVEIESNIKYIEKFFSYSKENPLFTIDHPFVKRYLKDKDFRINSQSIAKEVFSILDLMNGAIASLSEYFDDPNDIYQDYDFDYLISYLNEKLSHTYEEFKDYSKFYSSYSNTSSLMKDTIKMYGNNKWVLSNIYTEFRMALIKASYKSCRDLFKPYEEGFDASEQKYYEELSQYKDVERLIRYKNLTTRADANRSSAEFKNSLDELKHIFSMHQFSYQEREEFISILMKVYPISIACSKQLSSLPDDIYDHVIILDSGLMPNIELLNSIRACKDVLIINDRVLYDIRTQGYHETFVSRDTLYKSKFDFSKLPDSLIKKLNTDFDIEPDYRSDYLLKQDGITYMCIPDPVLSHEHDIRYLCEMSRFLSSREGLVLSVFDVVSYLFEN